MERTLKASGGTIRRTEKQLISDAFIKKKLRTVRPMLCYMVAYLTCFMLIEHWNRLHYAVIHTSVDDMIPFVPVFVIPYFLWFPYVTFSLLFLLLKNEKAYHRACTALTFGMTVFILVSVFYPNIHLMRPETMPDQSIFSGLVSLLYTIDTPTNLTPSIHVFNSLAIIAAFWNWDWKTDDGFVYGRAVKTFWRVFLTAMGLLISVSTMLIKQHSFSDVLIAGILFLGTYVMVYRFDLLFIRESDRVRRPRFRLRSARP